MPLPPTPPPSSLRPPSVDRSARARLRRFQGFFLERLRSSRLLQATMIVALLCYGGIPVLVIWQDNGVSRLPFATAGILVMMSLASWSLLFWWYPILARTADHLGEAKGERGLTHTLEIVAITCVVIVHALLAFIILHRAGGG